MDTIPVLVVTGLLGAGKTRFLSRLLAGADGAETALLVNEFADLGIDQDIFAAGGVSATALTGGCICCKLRGDLRRALQDLLFARARGDVAPFARIAIETSGAADPAPLVSEFLEDAVLRRRFPLAGIATVVDATVPLAETLADPVAERQIALAETLIASKLDLSGADFDAWRAEIAALNPAARVLRGDGPAAVADLLKPYTTNAAPVPAPVPAQGAGLRAFRVEGDAASGETPLLAFVESLAERCGSSLLRLKGVVPAPAGVAFLDVVRGTVYPPRLGVLAEPGRPRAIVIVDGDAARRVAETAAAHGLRCF
jgi:G3E family GTPase